MGHQEPERGRPASPAHLDPTPCAGRPTAGAPDEPATAGVAPVPDWHGREERPWRLGSVVRDVLITWFIRL
jgi:hypothetical protein